MMSTAWHMHGVVSMLAGNGMPEGWTAFSLASMRSGSRLCIIRVRVGVGGPWRDVDAG